MTVMPVWCQIYLFAFLAGAVSTLFDTPVFGRIARKFDFMDRPQANHKGHGRATPLLGGAAMFTGWLFCLAAGLVGRRLAQIVRPLQRDEPPQPLLPVTGHIPAYCPIPANASTAPTNDNPPYQSAGFPQAEKYPVITNKSHIAPPHAAVCHAKKPPADFPPTTASIPTATHASPGKPTRPDTTNGNNIPDTPTAIPVQSIPGVKKRSAYPSGK